MYEKTFYRSLGSSGSTHFQSGKCHGLKPKSPEFCISHSHTHVVSKKTTELTCPLAVVGVTLVVAGDSFFITLFIVILFHQMFEGLALGTRIATLRQYSHVENAAPLPSVEPKQPASVDTTGNLSATGSHELVKSSPVPMLKKLAMALAFAIATPIGMAIGTGVLQQFNGQDPSTLIAIGTLDALSAGILLWVGLVEMWARDWIFGGELVDSSPAVTICASVGLVAGMVLMSFLGKWA